MDEPYTLPDEDPFSTQSVLQYRHERSSLSNPYLAYSDLARPRDRARADSGSSYDMIEDEDIPQKPNKTRSFISLLTPRHTRSSSSSSTATTTPPTRPSFSSSSSSLRVFPHPFSDSAIDTPTKSMHSLFTSLRRRADVNTSSTTLSSGAPFPTHTLSNIADDEDSNIDNLDFLPPPSRRFSRASSQTSVSASSSYLPSASHSHLPTSTTKPSKRDRDRYFSSLTRSTKKKKKLIVSGIGASEFRKFDGVKRWCESFGELRSITRLPNGDLQIDFRDPDVADTVCRIRAKVFIAGVGSVQLSWIIGNKR